MSYAIEDLRAMIEFFNGQNETINQQIRSPSEAYGIWCQYQASYERGGDPHLGINSKGRVRVYEREEP